MENVSFIAEYFVLCSGTNERQLQAISDDIKKEMKVGGAPILGIEGYNEAKWILIDIGGVVVHIFTNETRAFYNLELLWGDAPKIDWESQCETVDAVVET